MALLANRRSLVLLAFLAFSELGTRPGRANGAFPAVSQLVADPSDSTHLVLRSNFGLLISHDRGERWDVVCEAGLGYQNIEPPIAVLGDGTTLLALANGVARGASECAFGVASGLDGYVADVARVPGTSDRAVAVSVDIERGVSQVWRSRDAGDSWQSFGRALNEFNAATLDVARDENELYVSGVSQAGTVAGVLARSTDGGRTWTRFDVPGASKVSAPYIAAIAADDANTLYVRLSGSPGRLLATRDGGAHFSPVLDFTGPMDGFTLSPDGRYALASGRSDGVWRAHTDDLVFERVSCTKLRCLSWSSAGLFACADEFQAGFLVGESRDSGVTFEPKLHLPCVRGPLACTSDSAVARACDAGWPALAETLGRDCSNALFTPHDECSGEGGASAGGSANSGAGAGAGAQDLRPRAGCSASASGPASSAWRLGLLWLVCGIARRRRAHRKSRL